jgi:hypothetical protein
MACSTHHEPCCTLSTNTPVSPQAALSKANSKLAAIQEVVKSAAGSGVSELLALPCAPPLTWNVLKAVLLVMGKNPHDMDTWLKCRSASGNKHLPFGQHFLLSSHDPMHSGCKQHLPVLGQMSLICNVLTGQSAALT